MNQPLVSVCIPAYNNADYIGETIECILKQSYQNLELIIVDDNSKDDTLEKIRVYADKDTRVKIYHNEKNLGMSGNWNYCLSLCKGEFIKLICADDILATETIEREVQALLENPSAVMVESDTKLIDLAGKGKGFYKRYPVKGLVSGKKVTRKGFFNKDYFGAPQANTFRREAYERVGGFDTNYTYILDYDFFAEIAKLGDIYIIHEPLNFFRVRGDSNTGQVMGDDKEKTNIYVAEHRYLLEKNKEELNLSKLEIEVSVWIRRFRCFAASIYLKLFVR